MLLKLTSDIPAKDSVFVEVWLDRRVVTRVIGYPGITWGKAEHPQYCIVNVSNRSRRKDLLFRVSGSNDQYWIGESQAFVRPRDPGSFQIEVYVNLGYGSEAFLGNIRCIWQAR